MTIERIIQIAAEAGARTALAMLDRYGEEAVQNAVKAVAQDAARAGAEALESEKAKIRKKESARTMDRRLYNTRLLLKNYRELKAHFESAVFAMPGDEELDMKAGEIWEILNNRSNKEEVYIDSIKKSAQRTMIILQHIDKMLEIYRVYCMTSSMQSLQRQYRVLESKYLTDNPLPANVIAEREHIHVRTVDKDLEAAIEGVTALLFGIDAVGGGRLAK